MRKCKSCGRIIEGNDRFCLICGAKIEEVKEELNNNETDVKTYEKEKLENSNEELKESTEKPLKCEKNIYDNREKNKKSPLKGRGNKLILISLILFGILFFSYKQLGAYMSNPQNVIEKFKVSILDKNEQKLIDLLDTESSSLKIAEEGAKVIIDYFNKNLDALDETINYLIRDSKLINKNDELSNMLNLNSDNEKKLFYIKNSKKGFLGLNKIKVYINPIFINVNSKVEGVKFFINGKEMCESDKRDFKLKVGPLVPGEYELSYKFNNEYVSLEQTETVDLIENFSLYDNEFIYEMGNELKYVTLKTSEKSKEATVYIDGKNTGKKVYELSDIGPILYNTKISIEIKQGDNIFKSDEVEVGKRKELYIDLDSQLYEYEIKNNKEEDKIGKVSSNFDNDYSELYYNVENLVKDYTYNFTVAVNNNNFEAIKKYLYPGEDLYNAQESVVKQFYNDGIREELIDIKIEKINLLNEQELSGTVEAIERYNIKQNDEEQEKLFNVLYEFKFNNISGNYELTNIKHLDKLN